MTCSVHQKIDLLLFPDVSERGQFCRLVLKNVVPPAGFDLDFRQVALTMIDRPLSLTFILYCQFFATFQVWLAPANCLSEAIWVCSLNQIQHISFFDCLLKTLKWSSFVKGAYGCSLDYWRHIFNQACFMFWLIFLFFYFFFCVFSCMKYSVERKKRMLKIEKIC